MNIAFINRFTETDLVSIINFVNSKNPELINSAVNQLFGTSEQSAVEREKKEAEKKEVLKIIQHVESGNYIAAIKAVRGYWGVGLTEAKFSLDSAVLNIQSTGNWSKAHNVCIETHEDNLHHVQSNIKNAIIETFFDNRR